MSPCIAFIPETELTSIVSGETNAHRFAALTPGPSVRGTGGLQGRSGPRLWPPQRSESTLETSRYSCPRLPGSEQGREAPPPSIPRDMTVHQVLAWRYELTRHSAPETEPTQNKCCCFLLLRNISALLWQQDEQDIMTYLLLTMTEQSQISNVSLSQYYHHMKIKGLWH